MSGVNTVILVGHLSQDPELKHLQNDVAVLSFSLATSEYTYTNGYKQESTQWHNIIMWRGLAELASTNLKKGSLIFIEGRIHKRSFKDKEGIDKQLIEIIAEYFTPLGRKSDDI